MEHDDQGKKSRSSYITNAKADELFRTFLYFGYSFGEGARLSRSKFYAQGG
jgi:hypothetical protein